MSGHAVRGWWRGAAMLAAGLVTLAAWAAGAQAARGAAAEDPDDARVIVKYRSGSALARSGAGHPRQAATLGRQVSIALQDGRVLGARVQGLRARGLSSRQLAARLAARPDVEWAVVDGRRQMTAVPNDPYYAGNQTTITPRAGQWYLRAPDATLVSAIDAERAWDITEGRATVTVAVLDTGVRFEHPDLAGKLYPGHDFVRAAIDGDGASDGPDSDASDPGNGHKSGCPGTASVWHGTEVSGLVGALTGNGLGMASVGRNVMVLPVRVLGDCGNGYDSDIIAGMRWAAGLSSTPVANPHPARILNLSLGGSGACSVAYAEALAEINAAGVAVVVAAGNSDGQAVESPANCAGAIAVAAVRHAGTKVGFSAVGPEVAVAAPGGNCVNVPGECLYPILTTSNDGTAGPGASGYTRGSDSTVGTSYATPLVAGTLALMLSVDPSLTPAQLRSAVMATARAFPTTGAQTVGAPACHAPDGTDQNECYCTTSTCGAGLLDAGAAVAQVQAGLLAPTAVISASTTTPTVGDPVTLSGSASTATSGRTLRQYQWAITSGAGLAAFVGATDGTSATLATSAAGTVVVQLTVTDNTGASHQHSLTLVVVAAPVVVTPTPEPATGGGGGAMAWGWLLGLAAAVAVLARRR